jgi:hypothetical protein
LVLRGLASSMCRKVFYYHSTEVELTSFFLSVHSTVTPTPAKTPLENMIQDKLVDQGLVTVKLDKGDSSGFYAFGEIPDEVGEPTCTYFFLRLNTTLINTFNIIATGTAVDTSQGFWMFPSPQFKVGSTTHANSSSGNQAIADTGTTLMLVSDQEVSSYYAAVSGSKLDNSAGGYVFPSSTKPPDFSFSAGETFFTVPGELIAFADMGNGTTFGGIQSRGSLNFSIYGDVALKAVYTVFDEQNTRIGFKQRTDY